MFKFFILFLFILLLFIILPYFPQKILIAVLKCYEMLQLSFHKESKAKFFNKEVSASTTQSLALCISYNLCSNDAEPYEVYSHSISHQLHIFLSYLQLLKEFP